MPPRAIREKPDSDNIYQCHVTYLRLRKERGEEWDDPSYLHQAFPLLTMREAGEHLERIKKKGLMR